MDSKQPRWGTRYYPNILITFLFTTFCMSQTLEQKEQIIKFNNQTRLNELIVDFKKEIETKKNQLIASRFEQQWGVGQQQLDGTVVALTDVGVDGTPLFYTTHMDPTSKVSRASALYAHGDLDLALSGLGMTVGIWDAGVARTTHREFDSRVKNNDQGEIDNHGTLVTGTVVSSGVKEKAQGVAFDATALTHDWFRDKIEVTQAAANGLLISNHSYGIKTDRVPDWYFGAYIKTTQDWDNIMYNAPYYLMVTAAGNAQNSFDNETPNFGRTQDGFDLLLGFATAKNGLVIAGADTKFDGNGNLKNVKVAGYSSFGPTDDGRIKPDLAGDGTLVHSASADSDNSYGSSMGTSMAAPGVSGSLLLLQEYHQELYGSYMKSATLKGLALHTADDVGEPGPDYTMGWGVINTKRAAETLKNKDFSTQISEESLGEGETLTYTVKASGYESLSFSISWTDPAGEYVNRGDLNASIAALTNDLDIRISQDGKTYFPWKLNPAEAKGQAVKGDNLVDPFERVDIPNAHGEYTITVSHKGNLIHGVQDFSLIVSGAELTSCRLETPTEIEITTSKTSGATLEWTSLGTETLYELQIKAATEDQWLTRTLWDSFFSLEDLEVGKKYSVRLRSVCSQNLSSEFSKEVNFVYDGEATVLEAYAPLSLNGELQISVYPNPVVNELTVETELSSEAYYSVVTTTGTTIKSGLFSGSIPVADLATGLYVLSVQDYSGVRTTKFIKK